MGGTQSTRKISVDNENAIQVSQEALERIQSQLTSNQHQELPQRPPPTEEQYALPPPYYYNTQKQQQDNAAEEAYWARRIDNLKRAHEKLSIGMKLEFQKTVKEANEMFQSVEKEESVQQLPCQDEKTKVMECYSMNPNQSLLCSTFVSQFNNCVCKSRIPAS